MSASTHHTTTATPESDPHAGQTSFPGRQRAAAICLITAPVAFAAAEVLSPESNGTSAQMLAAFASHRGAGLVAALLGIASVMLFVPGVLGLVRPITGRGRRWALTAAAATTYGLVTAHAALGGINIMFYAMTDPSLSRPQMTRLMDVLMSTPAAGLPLLLGHLIFGLGIIALGIAILRSRTFPVWTGAALILWIALDMVLGSLPVPRAVGDVTSSAFGVSALAVIGWSILTRRTGPTA
ncbi:uncharacterized protein (DUF697 family) [Phycicoccus badiiscoriae]|uniref:Uncharacterized protein (DUF697 family) n=1 Tax=Pedococcus badiiscoriae TaxID=642776 RepID=A0A852WHR8_9MICO|nr:hypothetical protein [Pedococcus badiiscoriae]NYG07111.1 uncharacterized protein (DUF697 family) [Pedococcus badiiscoriae]